MAARTVRRRRGNSRQPCLPECLGPALCWTQRVAKLPTRPAAAVLHALRTAAPVAAVRGNVDDQAGCQLPDHAAVDACGWSALVAHIVGRPPQGVQQARHARSRAAGYQVQAAEPDSLILPAPAAVEPAAAALIERLQPDIVIYGHSHKYSVDEHGGRVYINPGSAGPARFSLPRTAALLHLPPKGAAWHQQRPRPDAGLQLLGGHSKGRRRNRRWLPAPQPT